MNNLKNKTGLIKIELNEKGDYITISLNDSTVFEQYKAALSRIADDAEKMTDKLSMIKKRYVGKERTIAICRADVEFSENIIKLFDNVLGEGTIKKYFRKIYDELPDFTPGTEHFGDFINKMTPVMETLFRSKIDNRKTKHFLQRYGTDIKACLTCKK